MSKGLHTMTRTDWTREQHTKRKRRLHALLREDVPSEEGMRQAMVALFDELARLRISAEARERFGSGQGDDGEA